MTKLNFKSLFRTFLFSKFNFNSITRYIRDIYIFNNLYRKNNCKLKKNYFPILNDYSANHELDFHYLYHPAWALKKIFTQMPKMHVDLASKLDFSLAIAALIPIEYHDYRLVRLSVKNFKSFFTDIQKLPYSDSSIESLSCMHVIEHIGLGRYGDPIVFNGDIIVAHEMIRVMTKKGNLYFVTPVAEIDRIEFNAHRVYSYNSVISMFKDLRLLEFSIVTDTGEFLEFCSKNDLKGQNYACGCFHFIKD
jgi:hypothetical protein